MINLFGNIDGIPLYVDPYTEDNKILRGTKQGDVSEYTYGIMMPGSTFIIANPKTANMLYKAFQKKLRREKLLKINE